MHGSFGVVIGVCVGADVHVVRLADEAVFDHLAHHLVATHVVRGGADNGGLAGLLPGVIHSLGVGVVHSHARLAEDVLAGFKRSDAQLAVQIGLRADPDDVDVVRVDERLGRLELLLDAELFGGAVGALWGAIDNAGELDVSCLEQAGDVALTHDTASADKANS
jgi:hypothetical protein